MPAAAGIVTRCRRRRCLLPAGDHHDRRLDKYHRRLHDHISDFAYDIYPTEGSLHDALSNAARDTTISARWIARLHSSPRPAQPCVHLLRTNIAGNISS